jgi:hypothetical protein
MPCQACQGGAKYWVLFKGLDSGTRVSKITDRLSAFRTVGDGTTEDITLAHT